MNEKKNSLFSIILEKLASIKFFFYISILLSLDFYIAVMAVKGGIDPGFKKLNHYILIDWMDKLGPDHKIILGWLIVTFILVSFFGVNIAARVILEFKNLFSILRSHLVEKKMGSRTFILRKISVFIIHFSVVFMIFIHLFSSVTGLKFFGPSLEKGKIIKNSKLAFPLECIEIRKSGTKYSKPLIYMKEAGSKGGKEFKIPGWHKGAYYDVKAGYVKSVVKTSKGEKKVKKIGLKLFVHRLNVVPYLIFAAVLSSLGFLLHMGLRPENMGIFFRSQRKIVETSN